MVPARSGEAAKAAKALHSREKQIRHDPMPAENVDNLILEHLRAMRADISTLKSDVHGLTHRMGRVEVAIVGIRHDIAQLHEITADVGVRVDNLSERVDRIERQLDLVD